MEVVCPHCKTVNRVQDERLSDAPVCGACKEPILPKHPIELTVENFDAPVCPRGTLWHPQHPDRGYLQEPQGTHARIRHPPGS